MPKEGWCWPTRWRTRLRGCGPTAIVDLATLTGAMKVALGMRTGGLFATTDDLADGLLAAGDAVGEPLWRLPMPSDYESTLASDIADSPELAGQSGRDHGRALAAPVRR